VLLLLTLHGLIDKAPDESRAGIDLTGLLI
jgi:hypothetical protein